VTATGRPALVWRAGSGNATLLSSLDVDAQGKPLEVFPEIGSLGFSARRHADRSTSRTRQAAWPWREHRVTVPREARSVVESRAAPASAWWRVAVAGPRQIGDFAGYRGLLRGEEAVDRGLERGVGLGARD